MTRIRQLILAGLISISSNFIRSIDMAIAQSMPLPTIAIPDRLYDVQNQDPKYPLKTRISRDIEKQLGKFFVFTKADRSRIIKLRSILQPLADRNDPVALYWLAKTYDLYEFGAGEEKDAIVALKYYTKAADLGMATTEYFLSTVYRYSLMGLPKDERKVISYLDRAKLHGDRQVRVEILKDYARWYSPQDDRTDFTFIPRDANKMTEALRSAYVLNPTDPTIADWWGGDLFDRQQYSAALEVYRHSSNSYTHARIAQMYETGKGTSIDLPMALSWYKRTAKQQLLENTEHPGAAVYFRSGAVGDIYRLVCQQKIAPTAASPYFETQAYQKYLQESRNHQEALKLKTNPCIPIPGG